MKTNQSILFDKLLNNSCSEEELRLVIAELAKDKIDAVYHDLLLQQLAQPVRPEEITSELKVKLDEQLAVILADNNYNAAKAGSVGKTFTIYYKYVAAVLLVLSFGFYFYNQQRNKEFALAQLDQIPIGNTAVLTLADGKKIMLLDASNGKLAEQSGVEIFKNNDGQLSYTQVKDPGNQINAGLNTIETPKGGQYQLLLPDGTKVWLNTASSLSYPASFSAKKIREVELSGEAYFEVMKLAGKPFRVKTDQQLVEVLGTHFNVNSYKDERVSYTTLLEGQVRVSSFGQLEILKPGQQATITQKQIQINNIDPEESIAWKNGYFQFNDEKLESIMRKVARWYDVEIVYDDPELKKVTFAGLTNRFLKVSDLLNTLKMTKEVDFEVKGRSIRVKKN